MSNSIATSLTHSDSDNVDVEDGRTTGSLMCGKSLVDARKLQSRP